MKTFKLIAASLLALAGLASMAQAQGMVGDLVVGFRDQPDNVPTNYEVDLGSIGNYLNLPQYTVVNLSETLSAVDLAGIFSPNWNTGSNVTWGAAATVGLAALPGVPVPAKTTWVTQFDSIQTGFLPGGLPPPSKYKTSGLTTTNERAIGIENVETGLSAVNGFVQSTNVSTPFPTGFMPTASQFSWTYWLNNPSNGFGGAGSPIDAGTQLMLTPGEFSVVDLFQYGGGPINLPGTYVGSFELESTGELFFTNYVPEVPEPSVFAAILGAASLGFVMIRRRRTIT